MSVNLKDPELQEMLNMFIGGGAGPAIVLPNQGGGNVQANPYLSGQQYAQSIAGGENVPGMIAPGVSYSAARPDGYTQADLTPAFYNPGPVPVMPSATTKGNPLTIENQMPYAPPGVTTPERYTPMITNAESLKNLADLFNANMPSGTQVSFDPFIDGEPMAIDDLMPSVSSSPIDFSFNPFEEIAPVVEPMVEDLPSTGSSPIDFSFNPFDVPVDSMPSYFVPETPVVSLQDNPTGPVDMPAEVFEDRMEDIMDYDDLQDIIRNKEVLTQIPAEDGVRNQYQVELDNYINESENKKETYLDTFPVGGALNLGIPSLFENVVAPAVIPGLGFVQEAAQSFNPSPSPSPQNIRTSDLLNSFRNNSYDNVRKFGR